MTKLLLSRPPVAAPAPQRSAISVPLRKNNDALRCYATRRDLLTAAAALLPCCCAICLSRTQAGKNAYKSYFASAMATMMQSYEAEVEPVKKELFAEALRQAAAGTGAGAGAEAARGLDVLDLGCGALPNARLLLLPGSSGTFSPGSVPFPSSQPPVAIRSLVGVDSNAFMFKYAEQAAKEAGFEVLEPASSSSGGSGSSGDGRGEDGASSSTSPSSSSPSAPSSSSSSSAPRPTARFLQASAESPASLSASSSGIPDESVDVVLCTLLLCSVPDPRQTLAAAAAALRPGGVVAFLEHTLDPDPSRGLLRVTQRALDPLQRLLADGCHLTRDPVPLFEAGGGTAGGMGGLRLRLSKVERFRVEGGGLIAPHVSGIAVKL